MLLIVFGKVYNEKRILLIMKKEFMKNLTSEQLRVLRDKHTEFPFTGKLLHNKHHGDYRCVACGNVLFSSAHKFDSGSGWPSFYDLAKKGSVRLVSAHHWMIRQWEVLCAKCGGHLGHLYHDGPKEKTGKRYCINSCALKFKEKN